MKPLVAELEWMLPHEVFANFADEPFSLLFDSATAGPACEPELHGRWSFIAIDPFETLSLRVGGGEAPFGILKRKLAALPAVETGDDLPPFCGGVAGVFGYGLGRTLETLPPEDAPYAVDDQHLPDMALGFYDVVLAFDMVAERAFAVSSGLPECEPAMRAARARARMTDISSRLKAAAPARQRTPRAFHAIASNFTRDAYEGAVARVIEYIHAGDIFQANLSQRFETELAEGDTPYALYLRLRKASPAPFASFFNFGEGAIVSSSPERFLSCRNGIVETKPIKGTRPRGRTPEEDGRLAAELLASEKDRAENVMIVDLLRNDISRVCDDRSVTVDRLCALESFANVHHLVSTVRGRLR
ncbi:MAG: anthranilate synthase component I family protein, partial [Alphaproteobacteria bacterium]|nr:anthranilate synthase component I family protein [Alphaproteobacteria bacterium]MDX5415222.1 anthranilate synthase component I family protein [Alphaproteobacteria bacterium]MDX5492420.1 anthranilate synthase component I family protein [Alphaproteobacteria bacterium]